MLALNAAWRDMRIGLGRERTLRTLRVIHAAGHGYFLEQPDAFNALALDFIARSSS
jgi:hypothetical protein